MSNYSHSLSQKNKPVTLLDIVGCESNKFPVGVVSEQTRSPRNTEKQNCDHGNVHFVLQVIGVTTFISDVTSRWLTSQARSIPPYVHPRGSRSMQVFGV